MTRCLLLLGAFVLAGGCVRSSEVSCADGRICAPGNTCDDVNHLCISPGQIAACMGLADGDACTFAGVGGTCRGGTCDPLLCGDGVRSGTEACDGNDLGGADCTTAGFYDPAGLACTQFCTFDTASCTGKCGDGQVNGPELCDGAPPPGSCVDSGFDAGPLGCSGSCGASFASCARFGWLATPLDITQAAALAASNGSNIWIVGAAGTARAFDGLTWTAHDTGDTQPLVGVWAIAPDDVWAVSTKTVWHWDATAWSAITAVPSASYAFVWAASPSSVYIATTDHGVLSLHGASWQPLGTFPGTAITAFAGTGDGDLWAGDTSKLWHWNGSAWQAALDSGVNSIAARSPTDVWVVGQDSVPERYAAHWNGQAWTTFPDVNEDGNYAAISSSAPNDAWLATGNEMLHFDGAGFTEVAVENGGFIGGLVELSPGEIYGVTFDGIFYHYRGQSGLETQDTGDRATSLSFARVASGELFVVDGNGKIVRYDGSLWQPPLAVGGAVALWGTTADALFAIGNTTVGTVFQLAPGTNTWSPVHTNDRFDKIWGSSKSDIWAMGTGVASHFDGVSWADFLTATSPINAIAVTGPTDAWATDTQNVYHWAGTSWDPDSTFPAPHPTGIAAAAPDDVWAIDAHHAYHWNGTAWSTTFIPTLDPLTLVAMSATDDAWVASDTELFQFDGATWSPVRPPSDTNVSQSSFTGLLVTPGHVDYLYSSAFHNIQLRGLVRTRPWVCAAKETNCSDGVDNDCDGAIDGLDSDCP